MYSDAGMRNLSSGPVLQRVRPESLVTKVYQAIKGAILENRFVAGQELSIEGLAQELGVSSTPVREAIAQLKIEGLIYLRPNKKPVVVTLACEEIHALYHIRTCLEPYVVTIICHAEQDSSLWGMLEDLKADIKTLLKKLDKEEESPKLSEISVAYVKTDHAMQEFLAQGAEKGFSHKLINFINNYVYRLRLFVKESAESERRDRMREVLCEHLEILEAISAHDETRSCQAVIEHLNHGMKRTLAHASERAEKNCV